MDCRSKYGCLEGDGKINQHAITLQEAKNRNGGLELKAWIKRIEKEELSYHKLRKAMREECGGKAGNGKCPELFREIKGDNGDVSLRFWPVKIGPGAMSKENLREVQVKLKRALEIVEKALA